MEESAKEVIDDVKDSIKDMIKMSRNK